MKIILSLLLIVLWINLTACQTATHAIIPSNGPSMEQVYDSASVEQEHHDNHLTSIRQSFHRVPNPELTLYVFPHVAGKEDLPIPGYTTAVKAYERDHYALADE